MNFFAFIQGEACSTSKFRGTCKRLQKCPFVYRQTVSGKEPDLVCNFSGYEPVVCCPDERVRTTEGPSYPNNFDSEVFESNSRVTGKPLTNQDLPGQVAERSEKSLLTS